MSRRKVTFAVELDVVARHDWMNDDDCIDDERSLLVEKLRDEAERAVRDVCGRYGWEVLAQRSLKVGVSR